jgi:hypothetical protein
MNYDRCALYFIQVLIEEIRDHRRCVIGMDASWYPSTEWIMDRYDEFKEELPNLLEGE